MQVFDVTFLVQKPNLTWYFIQIELEWKLSERNTICRHVDHSRLFTKLVSLNIAENYKICWSTRCIRLLHVKRIITLANIVSLVKYFSWTQQIKSLTNYYEYYTRKPKIIQEKTNQLKNVFNFIKMSTMMYQHNTITAINSDIKYKALDLKRLFPTNLLTSLWVTFKSRMSSPTLVNWLVMLQDLTSC